MGEGIGSPIQGRRRGRDRGSPSSLSCLFYLFIFVNLFPGCSFLFPRDEGDGEVGARDWWVGCSWNLGSGFRSIIAILWNYLLILKLLYRKATFRIEGCRVSFLASRLRIQVQIDI